MIDVGGGEMEEEKHEEDLCRHADVPRTPRTPKAAYSESIFFESSIAVKYLKPYMFHVVTHMPL